MSLAKILVRVAGAATPVAFVFLVGLVTWYVAWVAVLWVIAGVVVLNENRGTAQSKTIDAQEAAAMIEVQSYQYR